MRFGSVCSGIEAASLAWNPLDWQAAWFAEIESFPSAVLKHHYPGTPNLGDMTMLAERIRTGEVEAPDLFCGGTPCQAFSVAGLRQSLADARGNLSLTFCEIANAIDSVRSVCRDQPAIIFWENVPGVLSTTDNAFGCFLGALSGMSVALDAPDDGWTSAGCVSGPQRTVAWRILDAQYFGVAQRRRRVFVVASARADFDPAAVLFEFDGVRRDIAPSREAREAVARGAACGAASGGGTVAARMVAFGEYVDDGTASAMKARDYKDATDLVAHTLRGEGFDASKDGTGRGTPLVPMGVTIHGTDPTVQRIASYDEVAQCLRARTPGNIDNSSTTVVQQPITFRNDAMREGTAKTPSADAEGRVRLRDPGMGMYVDIAPTLDCGAAHGVAQPVAFALQHAQIGRKDSAGPQGKGWREEVAFTQDSRSCADAVAVSYAVRTANTSANGHGVAQDVTHTLDQAQGQAVVQPVTYDLFNVTAPVNRQNRTPGDPCHTLARSNAEHAAVVQPVNIYGGNKRQDRPEGGFYVRMDEDTSKTLDAASGLNPTCSQGGTAVMTAMQVRRLTPVECERLQGFPDNYTAIPWRKKPASECPDGPRYKALGNSWAVPVVRWIGERIKNHLEQHQ